MYVEDKQKSLFEKFSKVEINTSESISLSDKMAVERIQAQYDELLKQLNKYLEIFETFKSDESSNDAFEYDRDYISKKWDAEWHKQLMFSPFYAIKAINKNINEARICFIQQIKYYFEKKYHLDLDVHSLEKDGGDVSAMDVVREIIDQCNGLSLTDKGIEKTKRDFREKVIFLERASLKGTKVALYDYVSYSNYSTTLRIDYSYGKEGIHKLIVALSYFDQEANYALNYVADSIPGWNFDEVDTSKIYNFPTANKLVGVKLYKNRRLDVIFKSPGHAKEFYELFELDSLKSRDKNW